jgi:hypothetical protein
MYFKKRTYKNELSDQNRNKVTYLEFASQIFPPTNPKAQKYEGRGNGEESKIRSLPLIRNVMF